MEKIPRIRANSEIGAMNRCPQMWWWSFREGLKPRGSVSDALAFGTWVHLALAAWYCGPGVKRGPHPAETFASVADDGLRKIKTTDATDEEVAKYTDLQDLGVILLDEYVKHYGRDEKMLIIQPEKTFAFDVPFPDWWGEATRKIMARLVGTTDGVYRDADSFLLWLLENKTAATIRTGHLPLDHQAGTYLVVVARSLANEGLIKPKERLKGIMYNFLRKGLPDDRPRDAQGYATNKPEKRHYADALGYQGDEPEFKKMKMEDLERLAAGYKVTVLGDRSKIQPKPLFHREPVGRTSKARTNMLLRLQNDTAKMEMYRTGELPITKTPHWSCERFCDFFEMCRLHEEGGNWQEYKKLMFTQEDPYADHRKSTDEPWGFDF